MHIMILGKTKAPSTSIMVNIKLPKLFVFIFLLNHFFISGTVITVQDGSGVGVHYKIAFITNDKLKIWNKRKCFKRSLRQESRRLQPVQKKKKKYKVYSV